MYTQNNKKFYIIGSNRFDFLDTTVEAISILLKCDLVIIPKNFEKEFKEFLIKNRKKILELSNFDFDSKFFLKKLFDLFKECYM